MSSHDSILNDIRLALERAPGSRAAARPPIVPPRVPGLQQAEIDRLLAEITALNGVARRLTSSEVGPALAALVAAETIRKAVLWETPRLAELDVAGTLRALGVELIPTDADKHRMAEADLGVTEADFALPETGTLGLLSAPDKPRSVSLLPRVHLALVAPRALRADLHQVFAEAKHESYLVLITGPSRTSDIELILTIGVHGPKALYAWVLQEEGGASDGVQP